MTTLFGEVKIWRRLYRDSEGDYHFLLDEAMGLRKGSRVSSKVEERRTEVKVGIAYEDWDEVGKAHYKLKEKTTYTCVTGNGALADALLVRAQGLASGEESKDIAQSRG